MNFVRSLTLRQLQIFDCVAQHLSIARAAELLHLTQPAVSMQIRQLEQVAELSLFDRTGRGLLLTEPGALLLSHARRILGEVKDAQSTVQAMHNHDIGSVTLGLVSTAKYFAPRLVARFAKAHPGIELRFVESNRDTLLRRLQDNEVDLALMGRPPVDLDAVSEPLAPNPHVIAAATDHHLASARRFDLFELRDQTFLLREPGSGTRQVFEKMCKNHLFEPARTMVFSSNETIKQAVMAGLGVSLLSRHTLSLELRAGEIAVLDVDGTPIERAWNIVRMNAKRLSPAATLFRRYLLENTAEYLAGR